MNHFIREAPVKDDRAPFAPDTLIRGPTAGPDRPAMIERHESSGRSRGGNDAAPSSGRPVVVTDGRWLHIDTTRVYHRQYPEARGEGRTLREAVNDLSRQLARGLDHTHGTVREALKRALADIQAVRPSGTRLPRTPSVITS